MRRFLAKKCSAGVRHAFSLVEMMVAVAVMIVALAVVTNVFSISSKTAATSQAISEVEAGIQRFFANLEADLHGIDSTRSVLVIDGVKQVASRSEEFRQAKRRWRVLVGDPTRVPPGYNPETDVTVESAFPTTSARDQYSDPRADKLMFFTNNARPSRQPSSAALPGGGNNDLYAFQRSLQRGANASLVQVVYGHASFATPTRTQNGNSFTWPPSNAIRHIEAADSGESPQTTISDIPLNKWTLAARRTLIDDVSTGVALFSGLPTTTYPQFKDIWSTGNDSVSRTTWDRITRSWSPPGDYFAGDSAALRFRDFLTFFAPRENSNGVLANLAEPFGAALANPYGNQGWQPARNGASRQLVTNLMYYPDPRGLAHHHIATISDVVAPDLSGNLAMGVLQGCAWFQVEFLMPEDPRNSLVSPISSQRDGMPRWCEVTPGQSYIFVPDTVENRQLVASQVDLNTGRPLQAGNVTSGWARLETFGQVIPPATNEGAWTANAQLLDRASNRRIRLWPYAIRVTVRVFDPGGKLQEPVTRTFVHRFDM